MDVTPQELRDIEIRESFRGYHRDDVDDWVAELSCLHHQHVRHQPPFRNRPWVESEQGRRARIGTGLEGPLCDRAELPDEWRHLSVSPDHILLLTADEARHHRWRNVITNALGATASFRLDVLHFEVNAGDRLLLCSDGVSEYVAEAEVVHVHEPFVPGPALAAARGCPTPVVATRLIPPAARMAPHGLAPRAISAACARLTRSAPPSPQPSAASSQPRNPTPVVATTTSRRVISSTGVAAGETSRSRISHVCVSSAGVGGRDRPDVPAV